MIQKGYLIEIKEGGRRARVKLLEEDIDVLLLYPYGETSNMQKDESSLVLVLMPFGSKTNAFGIPYNALLQPELEISEKAVGNFKTGNKITFKQNGDIEVAGTNDFLATSLANLNVTASSAINLVAPDVSLGDAISLVLNENASLSVTIPGGSSAGTYTVDINSAGQSKVSA